MTPNTSETLLQVLKADRARIRALESRNTSLALLLNDSGVALVHGDIVILSDTVNEAVEICVGPIPWIIGGGGGGGVGYTAGPDIDITGVTISREGTDVLLFSGSAALLLDYPALLVGLLAAAGASIAGDVIEMPAGTIVGDFAVPAGVMLRGRGWQSILDGRLTLGVGAGAEHLKVFQDVDTADDIIGIIGPATGEATIRDVQVSLNQAGAGKALGLLSNGGTLRAYECEVWVSGATGSVWGIAAVTGGIVEMNQGQVRAWWI